MAFRAYGKSVKSYTTWQALTTYELTNYRVPTSDNGWCYECTTAGTSGATQPVWPKIVNVTVQDGNVVWTCREKEEQANPLTVALELGETGGYSLKDIWVKSPAEATFLIYGSYDNSSWRYIQSLEVPVGELLSNHVTLQNAYPYIAVGTSTTAVNEIEIIAGSV